MGEGSKGDGEGDGLVLREQTSQPLPQQPKAKKNPSRTYGGWPETPQRPATLDVIGDGAFASYVIGCVEHKERGPSPLAVVCLATCELGPLNAHEPVNVPEAKNKNKK